MKLGILSLAALSWYSSVSADAVPCTEIQFQPPEDLEIVSVTANERKNYTVPAFKLAYVLDHDIPGLNFCNITIHVTRPSSGDLVKISVWLPTEGWNGRFMATGGGGWSSGNFDPSLGQAIQQGFAAAATDGGHAWAGDNSDNDPTPWALKKDGSVNWDLLYNFAGRSAHDMGAVGKLVTEAHFGVKPHHSYWSGCSNGGRQGVYMAHRYPDDFDGILAGAPALNFPELQMTSFWPQVVMNEAALYPSPCEFDFFSNLALEQCDGIDGLEDDVVQNIDHCDFDPFKAVGQRITCDNETITISNETATMVSKMITGPTTVDGEPLSIGIPPGCSLTGFANTKISSNGERVGAPFFVPDGWIRAFLKRDLSYDLATTTSEDFIRLYTQSLLQFNWLLDSDPNLSGLQNAGHKLLSWHGTLDNLIPYNSSVQYHNRVEETIGGKKAVDDVFRLFLAPGVEHCDFGNGPVPVDPINALVSWVEDGIAPDTIPAETTNNGTLVKRNLCVYPKQLKYVSGDAADPESWTCVDA